MTYQETLKSIYDDPHIWAQEDRAAVTQACLESLQSTGRLHIKDVRARLKEQGVQVAPHRIGANVHGIAQRLKLQVIGHAPNGGDNGNRNKMSPVWARKDAA